MINLWLDDERTPGMPVLKIYKEPPYIDLEWEWVKTVPEFQAALARHGITNIGYVALDHDLGVCEDCERRAADMSREQRQAVLLREPGKGSYSSCIHNGDGTTLVRWMREHRIWPAIKPTVHSYNPDGGRRMREEIDAAYRELAVPRG